MLRHSLTPGELLVFLTYLRNAFKPVRDLAKYTGRLAKATAAGERVLDLLEREPEVRNRPGAVPAPPFEGAVLILHERLPGVAQHHPAWTARLARVLAACDRLGATLPPPRLTGIHRDFYADQVLVDGARLYLVDFDLYCLGDPALDVGNFLGHIAEQSLRTLGDAAALADCEAALTEQFIALAGAALRPAIQAYRTLTLVRHIALSTQFPDRRRFTAALLDLCEQELTIAPRPLYLVAAPPAA